jgi:hypothetical protein
MLPLPALVTRAPRPAERSVLRRLGIVFKCQDAFRCAVIVPEPKAVGAQAFEVPRSV